MDVSVYVPIDISGEFLRASARALAEAMPGVNVIPQEGDFTHRLDLPREVTQSPALGFFPGSTIGTFAAPRPVALQPTNRKSVVEGKSVSLRLDLGGRPITI